jgi:hypothetical protein
MVLSEIAIALPDAIMMLTNVAMVYLLFMVLFPVIYKTRWLLFVFMVSHCLMGIRNTARLPLPLIQIIYIHA